MKLFRTLVCTILILILAISCLALETYAIDVPDNQIIANSDINPNGSAIPRKAIVVMAG